MDEIRIFALFLFALLLCFVPSIILHIINKNNKNIAPESTVRNASKSESSSTKYAIKRLVELDDDGYEIAYTLERVEYTPNTRTAKITFCESKQYRTIERYVTRNYVKHPVYSELKTKRKTILKSIKMSNANLEDLEDHDDCVVSYFAYDIVERAIPKALYPSWFLRENRQRRFENAVAKNNALLSEERSKMLLVESNANMKNDLHQSKINDENKRISKLEKTIAKRSKSLEKATSRKKNVFLYIITLGLYCRLQSEKYKRNLQSKISDLTDQLEAAKASVVENEKAIQSNQEKVQAAKEDFAKFEKQTREKNETEKKQAYAFFKSITPLPLTAGENENFTPLKAFLGMDYSKIVGCYVIKNAENGKCYVGQSKDIIRRIKQHFHGTEPANIIFAEDYFKTKLEDSSELFEIKIIECTTKDELDKKEKELIELYEAFEKGYNGTKGNK